MHRVTLGWEHIENIFTQARQYQHGKAETQFCFDGVAVFIPDRNGFTGPVDLRLGFPLKSMRSRGSPSVGLMQKKRWAWFRSQPRRSARHSSLTRSLGGLKPVLIACEPVRAAFESRLKQIADAGDVACREDWHYHRLAVRLCQITGSSVRNA